MAARDGHPTEMDIATLELQRAELGLKLAHARAQAIGEATRPLKRPVNDTELADALHKIQRPLDGSVPHYLTPVTCNDSEREVHRYSANCIFIGGVQRLNRKDVPNKEVGTALANAFGHAVRYMRYGYNGPSNDATFLVMFKTLAMAEDILTNRRQWQEKLPRPWIVAHPNWARGPRMWRAIEIAYPDPGQSMQQDKGKGKGKGRKGHWKQNREDGQLAEHHQDLPVVVDLTAACTDPQHRTVSSKARPACKATCADPDSTSRAMIAQASFESPSPRPVPSKARPARKATHAGTPKASPDGTSSDMIANASFEPPTIGMIIEALSHQSIDQATYGSPTRLLRNFGQWFPVPSGDAFLPVYHPQVMLVPAGIQSSMQGIADWYGQANAKHAFLQMPGVVVAEQWRKAIGMSEEEVNHAYGHIFHIDARFCATGPVNVDNCLHGDIASACIMANGEMLGHCLFVLRCQLEEASQLPGWLVEREPWVICILDGGTGLYAATVAKLLAALLAIGGFQPSFHFGQCPAAVSSVYGQCSECSASYKNLVYLVRDMFALLMKAEPQAKR